MAFRPSGMFNAVRVGNNLHVTWPSGGLCQPVWRLQSTPELGNPSSSTVWTDVSGASPKDIPIGRPAICSCA